jgi:hypothetical protein
MRIYGPNGTAAAAAPATRRAASGTFTLAQGSSPQPAATAAAPRTIGGIETLLALQGVQGVPGVEDPVEKRQRAVKRGRSALDVLDALKMGLLAGTLEPVVLGRLKAAASGLKHGSGDPGLDEVLAEIELRVEVELAKMAARRS